MQVALNLKTWRLNLMKLRIPAEISSNFKCCSASTIAFKRTVKLLIEIARSLGPSHLTYSKKGHQLEAWAHIRLLQIISKGSRWPNARMLSKEATSLYAGLSRFSISRAPVKLALPTAIRVTFPSRNVCAQKTLKQTDAGIVKSIRRCTRISWGTWARIGRLKNKTRSLEFLLRQKKNSWAIGS